MKCSLKNILKKRTGSTLPWKKRKEKNNIA